MKLLIVAIIVIVLQQNIKLSYGLTCASNPCNLVAGTFDSTTGYCCTDLAPGFTDSVCTCPNNVPPVVNGPCRTAVAPAPAPGQAICSLTCLNGGVCNIVNNQQVCWCTLGFSGSSCELQGIAGRCSTGVCSVGTCVEQTIGASVYAYCYCDAGYTGTACNQCYFTCSQAGIFPDTANCAVGRYFYCPQATGAPIAASCPNGQRFNRLTNLCDATYNCT